MFYKIHPLHIFLQNFLSALEQAQIVDMTFTHAAIA